MNPEKSQNMLDRLRESMNMSALTPEEQAQCEIKIALTEKIDHILYIEWDPIGVHSLCGIPDDDESENQSEEDEDQEYWDCSDEYHRYLPDIVDMVFDGESIADIADALYELDEMIMGSDLKKYRRCEVAAVMMSRYGPHADKNPFVPVVNTKTPQAAYQTALDLITQTRIDAYEKNWKKVSDTFEQVIAICALHFPEKKEFQGACLNNLGLAYAYSGDIQKAIMTFSKALSKLESKYPKNKPCIMICLDNVINCHEHLGQFNATLPYLNLILRIKIDESDDEYDCTDEIRERLANALQPNRPLPKINLYRLSVEDDQAGRIQNIVYID